MRNLHSKFGHTRPLGSGIIRYVRDRPTDRQTDGWTDGRTKATLIAPFPTVGGIITMVMLLLLLDPCEIKIRTHFLLFFNFIVLPPFMVNKDVH